MMERILVAVDGSRHSQAALEFAAELAGKFDGRLHIVHVPQGVASERVMFLGGASVTLHASRDEIEAAATTLIDSAKHVAEQHGAAAVTTEVVAGHPAHEIVACAERTGADVLVIGSRGLGDLGGLLLGSVSHKVNHAAPCTCITVRA